MDQTGYACKERETRHMTNGEGKGKKRGTKTRIVGAHNNENNDNSNEKEGKGDTKHRYHAKHVYENNQEHR